MRIHSCSLVLILKMRVNGMSLVSKHFDSDDSLVRYVRSVGSVHIACRGVFFLMQSAATVVVVAMTAGGVVLVNKAQNLYSLSHGAHWANNCRFGTRGGVHLYILGGYDASCM